MKQKQYIYTVYDGKIHRAEVAKVTDQQVYLEFCYGGCDYEDDEDEDEF